MAKLALLIVLLLKEVTSQETIVKSVVEGLSTNTDILCNLDRQFHPLYWDIQGKIFDLGSIPSTFTVRGHEAISIPAVNRSMDGWRFQCFTIDLTNEDGLNHGLITFLNVFFVIAEIGTGENTHSDLLQPSLRGLNLNYLGLQFGPENTTLSWFNFFDDMPSIHSYQVTVFSQGTIDTTTLSHLVPFRTFPSNRSTITVDTQLLMDSANNPNYFRISTEYAYSTYFHNLSFNGNTTSISANGTEATFEIPENLRSDSSVQLIWPKDSNTQCVCPPVELISQCACNMHYPNNIVSIFNHIVNISNLTQEMGEGEVTLHFVSSVSSGCQDTCNLRSIRAVFKIIIAQVGYPQRPFIDLQSNEFCFTTPVNHINSVVYEVTLTDSTGSLTRLSDVYSISRCLTITSDLYPDVCGPFQLSVAAINSVGREVTGLTIMPNNVTVEPTPCTCYQKKEKIQVATIATTPTSTNLMLTCGYRNDLNLTIIQINNITVTLDITVPCNSTETVHSLTPFTNYSVFTGEMLHCLLTEFQTDQADIAGRGNIISIAFSALLCTIIGICLRI